ncbi:metallophosphoesterase [Corallococcus exiguus]|uniref:metallophosphoesterase n=1 Tax=Corallococcus exiguus TaxID=83462 RepID=UPI0015617587|nr:metallophosphoesterase [Corallococcus exiguus]NRD52517.1 metallophosphoesterase [Corallococcus exiguus]NRD62499.1 metallophosphoesterase [Corallococcus exiguus]
MEKLVLVHLSDIHFTGSSGTSIHDLDSDVRHELLRDAAALTKELGGATGVLVTGDIAFSGQCAEYERAASWLLEFCRAIGCPDESVWVVPGNHDVDRKIANSKVTKTLHESIRAKQGPALDKELREILSDESSAKALLAPLADYNTFAARFQCSISAAKPYWERDLTLPCGTIIRLRGLCSTLVSNQHDAKNNIVLGQAQVNVHRVDGVEYLMLCHHPPDWLQDQDTVVSHLESKVRMQLFGHKHSQRVQEINKTLRVTAGAMHPERDEGGWEPMYNVIEISRLDDQQLGVRLFQRRWHKVNHYFLADQNRNTNQSHHDYVWQGCPRPARKEPPTVEAQKAADSAMSAAVAAKTKAKDTEAMLPPTHERRLTFRFLTLAFRHQIAIANILNVLTDEDRALSDEALFRELFKRAAANGLLAKLWDETEKRHSDPAPFNPFETLK